MILLEIRTYCIQFYLYGYCRKSELRFTASISSLENFLINLYAFIKSLFEKCIIMHVVRNNVKGIIDIIKSLFTRNRNRLYYRSIFNRTPFDLHYPSIRSFLLLRSLRFPAPACPFAPVLFLLIFLRWHRNSIGGNGTVGRTGERAGRIFIPRSIHLGYTDISPRGRLRKDNNYRPGVPGESWAAAIKRVCQTSRRREAGGDEKEASGARREEPGARRQHLPGRGPPRAPRSRHTNRSKRADTSVFCLWSSQESLLCPTWMFSLIVTPNSRY